jgi:2,4-dienoyl-CoA reductase-like NADH-dependent reductase (Old Yellow Enzyme family)
MVEKMTENKINTFEPFQYKSLSQLENKIEELKINIPINSDLTCLETKKRFRNTFIPNRLGIQPMEGFDAKKDGPPSDLTKRRYKRYANSGAGLIWFEATAFMKQGRSNSHQLMINEQNLNSFRELVEDTRKQCNETLNELGFDHECILILQLNHSGRYSKKEGKPHPIKAYTYAPLEIEKEIPKAKGKIVSDLELKEIEDKWIKGARLAKRVGFDGVDIKSCHGYLINELLSAHEREDSKYGGEKLADRARLLINIIEKTKKSIKDQSNFFITTRLSAYNGIPFPHGFGVVKKKDQPFPAEKDLREPKKLISMLYERGVKLINISIGNPHHMPHLTRPYDLPTNGGDMPSEHPLFSLHRVYTITDEIKSSSPDGMVIIGSAYSYLRQYAGNIAAGLINKNMVDICGFGRMAFANPEFPKQLFQEGKIDKQKTCITCSKCSELMGKGKSTGCVIRDPLYKRMSSE